MREGGFERIFFPRVKKKTVPKTKKMVDITEITIPAIFVKNLNSNNFQVFGRFFFSNPREKKTRKIDLVRGKEDNLCVPLKNKNHTPLYRAMLLSKFLTLEQSRFRSICLRYSVRTLKGLLDYNYFFDQF